jgi:hypothetical protein
MLMAVRKAVASILCAGQPFDMESQPHIEPIRACSDAARRNLRLGRLMRLHSPRQKLLLPDLHHIFNAAIVLIMHQVVFVNLRTQDLDDVGWALEVFETEAETGSEYGRDCSGVLHDFKYLAHQLRNPIHDPDTKQILLSSEGVLRDLLPDEAAAEMRGENGHEARVHAGPSNDTPTVADMYQTLSSWWNADSMWEERYVFGVQAPGG